MPPSASADTLCLENAFLEVRLRPGLGAKLCSLRDRRSGREWLLPSQLPGGGYPQPSYGDDFSRFDTSGFDECFPTVSAAPPWPDHGELWSRAWAVAQEGDSLVACIEGRAWPYTFTRRATLEEDTLRLDYTLENHATDPFPYLWSAHPLLKVTPGMRLVLPEGVHEAFVNGASDDRMGVHGEMRPWPGLAPGLDLSTVPPVTRGQAVKLFIPDMREGRAGIHDPRSGDALTFTWDPAELPHLGLWLCYGGWPMDGRPGHLTVALEPCSGMPDQLQEAAARGTCAVLGPGGRSTWNLRLRSHTHCPPNPHPGVAP